MDEEVLRQFIRENVGIVIKDRASYGSGYDGDKYIEVKLTLQNAKGETEVIASDSFYCKG